MGKAIQGLNYPADLPLGEDVEFEEALWMLVCRATSFTGLLPAGRSLGKQAQV